MGRSVSNAFGDRVLHPVCVTASQVSKQLKPQFQKNYYLQDILQSLQDRVQSQKENRSTFRLKSYLSIHDGMASKTYYQIALDQRINSIYYQQFSETHRNTLSRFQQQKAKFGTDSRPLGSIENTLSDVMIPAVMRAAGLEEKLLQLFLSKMDINEMLECLMKSNTVFQRELQIIRHQMKNVGGNSEASVKREQILRNTGEYLEEAFAEKIENYEVITLNKVFVSVYQVEQQKLALVSCKGIYPSGVLFVLLRAGKLARARKVFEGWGVENAITDEVSEFLSYYEAGSVTEEEAEYIYNVKLGNSMLDSFFIQCYLVLLRINEMESVFHCAEFAYDKDLYAWMNLATCFVGDHDKPHHLQQHHTLFASVTLEDLQLNSQGTVLMDIYLQRYERFLERLCKRHELIYEIPVLMLLFQDYGLLSDAHFRFLETKYTPVLSLAKLIFPKNLVVGALLIQKHGDDAEKLIAHKLASDDLIVKLVEDHHLRAQFEETALSKDTEAIARIYEETCWEYCKKKVHEEWAWLMDKISCKHALGYKYYIRTFEEMAVRIDRLHAVLKLVRSPRQLEICIELVEFLLYCEALVNLKLHDQDAIKVGSRKVCEEWRKIRGGDRLKNLYRKDVQEQRELSEDTLEEIKAVDVLEDVLARTKQEAGDMRKVLDKADQVEYKAMWLAGKAKFVMIIVWLLKQVAPADPHHDNRLKNIVARVKDLLRKGEVRDKMRMWVLGEECRVHSVDLRNMEEKMWEELLLTNY